MSGLSRKERRLLRSAGAAAMAIVLLGFLVGLLRGDDDAVNLPFAFERIATYQVASNELGVSATMLATADNGNTLVYTDSVDGIIGFVDISNPAIPTSAGVIELSDEPRALAIREGVAFVAIASTAEGIPSGRLEVFNVGGGAREGIVALDLGGEPDAIAVSDDGRFAAVTLENAGQLEGSPPGEMVIIDTVGEPATWGLRRVSLTGLAATLSDDPEPENVAISSGNEAVISLQENNHLVIVDLETGVVTADFPAGETSLSGVDLTIDRLGPELAGEIAMTESGSRRREPDGVAWIDDGIFVTADEGGLTDADGVSGGSHSITVFDKNGTVIVDSGAKLDHEAARLGHYPEHAIDLKGGEPEEVEVARFDDRTLVLASLEQGDAVGVFEFRDNTLELLQLLPTGVAPEGVVALPERGIFAVASEATPASVITIYQVITDAQTDPVRTLTSQDDADGIPVPWGALSGLTGDPSDAETIYAVSDASYARGHIFTIDVSEPRGVITSRLTVTTPDGDDFFPDLEGIASAPEGGFWLVSEGRVAEGQERENLLLSVDSAGTVERSVPLPSSVTVGATDQGLSGVAVSERDGSTEFVYVTFRIPQADSPTDVGQVGRYDPASDEWAFSYIELLEGGGDVTGLAALPDGRFAALIADTVDGSAGGARYLAAFDLTAARWRPDESEFSFNLTTAGASFDLAEAIEQETITRPARLDGVAVTAQGELFVVSDNANLRAVARETAFLHLGLSSDLL